MTGEKRLLSAGVVVLVAALCAACGNVTALNYPKLPSLDNPFSGTLSKSEQQDLIEDLNAAKSSNDAEANGAQASPAAQPAQGQQVTDTAEVAETGSLTASEGVGAANAGSEPAPVVVAPVPVMPRQAIEPER